MRRLSLCVLLFFVLTRVSFAQEQTPYEIALQRIEVARESNAVQLDLANLGLTELPIEIGELDNLQKLVLDFNRLRTLPKEIGHLSNLRVLWLANNQLRSLPAEISNLTNLQYLRLNYNQLNELPKEIGNLSNLEKLDLTNNQLNTLPSEMGLLTSLWALSLTGNQFRDLPKEIFLIPDLSFPHLYLDDNPVFTELNLGELKDEFGQFDRQSLYDFSFQQRGILLSMFELLGFGVMLWASFHVLLMIIKR